MKPSSLLFAATTGILPALLAWSPIPAHACSFGNCGGPSGFPLTATIPANAGGVFLNPGYGAVPADAPSPGLQLTAPGGVPIDLGVTTEDRSVGVFERMAVRTADTLPVGATLTLRAANRCDAYASDAGTLTNADVQSWTVADAVPLPTSLGMLTVQTGAELVPQPTYDGSCDTLVSTAGADVSLALANDAAPWADVFVYETVVDGQVFLPVVTASPVNGYSSQSQEFGGSWLGRGRDVVFANCGGNTGGVAAGAHTVFMRGVLPDGTVVTTPEVAFTLDCGPAPCDAGTGTLPCDAGTGTQPTGDARGCSTAVGRADATTWPRFAGLALGLAALLRRRSSR